RRPSLWSAALLTRPTCGMGIVWFACRREWRRLGLALATTAAIVGVSVLVSPQLWLDWLHVLAGGGSGGHPAGAVDIPLVYRLPVALCLAVYAARRSRPAFLVAAAGRGHPAHRVQVGLRVVEAIRVGGGERDPERLAARDDRDLAHRIGVRHEHADERVPGLVVGGAAPVGLGHHHLALGAED